MIHTYRTSRKGLIFALVLLFLFMLVLNTMTPMLADDFQYYYGFHDLKPIDSIESIIPSMIAHGKQINGRYFAHGLVQLFLMLPPLLFDIVNAAVFVATIYLAYHVCNKGKKTDTLFFLSFFGAYWLFQWNFGQTTLWLDGSVNYLFALFFSLIFILPYLYSVLYQKNIHPLLILPHMLLSVWVGGYLEMTAVGFVGTACLLLGADLFYFKNRRSLLLLPSILCALFGFGIMALAPAQIANKLSDFSILNLLSTLGMALLVFASLIPLIILFIALLIKHLKENTHKRRILSAIAVALGAIASNLVLVFAKYYSLRCSICCVFLTTLAVGILWGTEEHRLPTKRLRLWLKIFSAALLLAIVVGTVDIGMTLYKVQENEQIIAEALDNGESEITLECPVPITKYNALMGLRYLSIDDTDPWPNPFLARYYGIEQLHGSSSVPKSVRWLLTH